MRAKKRIARLEAFGQVNLTRAKDNFDILAGDNVRQRLLCPSLEIQAAQNNLSFCLLEKAEAAIESAWRFW